MTIAKHVKPCLLSLLLVTPLSQAHMDKLSASNSQSRFLTPGITQQYSPNSTPRKNKPTLAIKSSQQAIARVQQQYQGKVLRVQSNRSGNSYQVKMLSSDGRVFYVTVDARTGAVRRN
ncbi:PepSY domain-containing protein [Shewanella maritima]|nr:PepSY domain-containing protein [Shewanella maritima]